MFGVVTSAAVALVVALGSLAGLAPKPHSPAPGTSLPTTGSGPASKYDCNLSIRPADAAYTGADGTASAIGWAGNYQGVVTCSGEPSTCRTASPELRHFRDELRLRDLHR